jgi:hypothetical protein
MGAGGWDEVQPQKSHASRSLLCHVLTPRIADLTIAAQGASCPVPAALAASFPHMSVHCEMTACMAENAADFTFRNSRGQLLHFRGGRVTLR